MESVTHSRLPNEAYSVLPRKASSVNKGGFPAKTMYDDVYGGPPNFGFTTLSPSAEDYSEIFSGFHASHASSIPVLDLPAVDETQVGLDVRCSGFNYAEIFGGFNGLDFGIFFEDLLTGQYDDRDGYSSEQAWTQADIVTSSEESEPHGNSPILSNEDPYKPCDGTTAFSISYHRVNPTRNETMSSGRTYLAELHAVSSYSLLYDETASVQKTSPQLQVTDDDDLCTEFRTSKMKGLRETNTKLQTANCSSIEQTLGNGLRVQKSLSRDGSCSTMDFVTISEITLRTQPCQVQPPSRPPPTPVDVRKDDSSGFSSTSMQNTCKRISGDNSPPFFDVEIDVGSSASASVCSMQEPIGKAQEQLGRVKHLVGKMEAPGGQVKPGPKFNGNKGRTQVVANRLDDLDFEELQCSYYRSQGWSNVSVNAELIGSKATQEINDSSAEDILLDISKRPAAEKHIGETFSSLQWTGRNTISGKQKGIIQSSEPMYTQYFVNKSESNIGQMFSHDMEVHECAQMERKAAIDEAYSQVKTVQEIHHPRDYKVKHKAQKEVCQHMETIRQQTAANNRCKKRDVKTGNGGTCTSMKEKEESNVRMVHDCVLETKGETSHTNLSLQVQNMMTTQQVQNKLTEGEKKADEQHETENDLKQDEYVRKQRVDKSMDHMKWNKGSGRQKDRKQRKKAPFYLGQVDDRERQKNDMETAEKVLGSAESFEQDEEAHVNDIEKILLNVNNKKQSGKSTVAIEKDEDHKKSDKGQVNEGSPKVSLQNEEFLKGKMKLLKEERNKMLTDTIAQEENIRVKDACEGDENRNRVEEANSSQTIKKVSQNKRKPLFEKVTKEDAESRCNDIANLKQKGQNEVVGEIESNEAEMGFNNASKIHLHGAYVELMVCDGAWTVEDYDNLQAHSYSKHEQNGGNAEGSQLRVTDGECGKGANSEIRVNKLEPDILKDQPVVTQVCIPSIITEDMEPEIFSENEANMSFPFNGNLNNSSNTNIFPGIGQMQNGEIENVGHSYSGPKKPEKKFNDESVGRQKNDQDVSNTVNKEELREKLSSGDYEINFENEFKIGTTVSTILEGKENMQLPLQKCNLSEDTEIKEKNLNYAPTVEMEYERARRERELEIDCLRKLEEREREREKDRMAVGKASLQGHGKAYAEAHERAERAALERAALERAAAESRQKLLAEARVRLEKACAEAKEKLFSDEVEPETRLKAEQVAVDRAIAEAHERALDGSKVEKAALDAREQLESSVSADFSTALRNKGGKPAPSVSDVHEEQFQNVGSRFPYSSTGATSFVEKSGVAEGESAKRCRARLERYRRMAEQAAKALAEKNMRDLIAQKEQAERNRLAETLDAEVKRWSSGKEGNLRALLSTLQYILGPNSGWQPIPLTEVITSAAVKKAYRKATLCVHPDKLQQRGASIQHKYICEKVFDLLKDAWNKFNSEER